LAFAVIYNGHVETWYLSVPVVASDERAVAREVLLTLGLPGVREWLSRPRPETWHEGFQTFQVGYAVEPLRFSLSSRSTSASSIPGLQSSMRQRANEPLQLTGRPLWR
jgi:hypothetical protein